MAQMIRVRLIAAQPQALWHLLWCVRFCLQYMGLSHEKCYVPHLYLPQPRKLDLRECRMPPRERPRPGVLYMRKPYLVCVLKRWHRFEFKRLLVAPMTLFGPLREFGSLLTTAQWDAHRSIPQTALPMDCSRLQTVAPGTDFFNLLPTEILVQILAKLPFHTRLALCRRAALVLSTDLQLDADSHP